MATPSLPEQLLEAIHQARPRVYQVGNPTPLEPFALPDQQAEVWVKREDLGPIKAYKWRGAFNAMASLSESERARGIVTASAGNHAQGVALAAHHLRCHAHIFMPLPTPQVKQDAVLKHGGDTVTIIKNGDSFSETQKAARTYCEEHGLIFIPPYDSLPVMAGQGTLADEVVMSGKGPFDYAYLPIGGGGLASATATLLKSYWPDIRLIGVEGEGQASMKAAFEAGEPRSLDYVDLFCDGTAVTQVGNLTYEICRSQLDDIITVSDAEVCAAIKTHWDHLRVIPEPSGAMSLAGYLQEASAGKIPAGSKVLTILCGSNMDFAKIAQISRQSSVAQLRDQTWAFSIPEKRGSLMELLSTLPPEANIVDLQYGRTEGEKQRPLISLSLPAHSSEILTNWVASSDIEAQEITSSSLARYRVIPFTPSLYQAPIFVEVEFPERAGALLAFMREMSSFASMCYFTYRYSGERVGHAFCGFDFDSPEDREQARPLLDHAAEKTVRSMHEIPVQILTNTLS